MMEGRKFGSDDEDAVLNLEFARGREEKEEKNVLHHFRYPVTVYAIKTQGVSFIVFVNKEFLSHINPAFVLMSFDRRHVWDVVNIVYIWHYWSQKVGKCHILPKTCRP